MQPINVKTSEESREIIKALNGNLPAGTSENFIARLALGYSLAKGTKFDLRKKASLFDSKGKEYKDQTLFPPQRKATFVALVCQHYSIHQDDPNIAKYIKYHIDDGLVQINTLFKENPGYTFMDFLMDEVERGIDFLSSGDTEIGHVENRNQRVIKTGYSSPLNVLIGRKHDGTPISLVLNDTARFKTMHMSVAGKSGTGKTQFAFHFLREVTRKSGFKVNFTFLDFKGVEASEGLDQFLKTTEATLINAPDRPFPINPLTFIDTINENNRILGISKFVDIVKDYANLGSVQGSKLKQMTRDAFDEAEGGKYPTLDDIYSRVLEDYDEDRDSLTDILEKLTEVSIFEKSGRDNAERFLNSNFYLSLGGKLNRDIRITAVFLLINYINNTFMNMEEAPVNDGVITARYVLMIDEAHNLFREPKARIVLETILREIRSKGVAVFLLSQGIGEFAQSDFDLSSQSAVNFLMDIADKGNKRTIQKFLQIDDKDLPKAMSALGNLSSGAAIANISGQKVNEEFLPWKFYETPSNE